MVAVTFVLGHQWLLSHLYWGINGYCHVCVGTSMVAAMFVWATMVSVMFVLGIDDCYHICVGHLWLLSHLLCIFFLSSS